MAHYIIQTIAFQVFFLLIYDVFLKNETFFNWNRFYLMVTIILSIILPFIKIESFKNVVPQNYIISLPEIVLGETTTDNNAPILLDAVIISNNISYWQIIFYLGLAIAAFMFLFKLTRIAVLIFKNPKKKSGRITLVKLLNSNAAFSFFRYVFLGEFLKTDDKEAILKHETIHVNQMHTADLLFFEILRILFWFNPLVHMYQNRITTLHEFIADAEAVKYESKSKYYQNLLSQVFDTKKISFINPFFKQSLIKKRIIMLQKSKSKQIKLFKYALLIPVVFGMLVYSSCIQSTKTQNQTLNTNTGKEGETILIKKIKAVKSQIQIQGNISDEEEKGLGLLLRLAKQDELDTKLIKEVQTFTSQNSQTELIEKISDVFEQIQVQGNITNLENKTLKELLIFTSDDGFDDPFFEDILQGLDVPFPIVDQAPIFPGCEDLPNKEQKVCMSTNISRHVNKNFNTKLAKDLKLTGRQRITVIFKIDTEGNIKDVRSRAPHPDLEAEAIRVIKTLPKMIPGEQRGKLVNVPYSLPIIFQVADTKAND